MKNIMSLLNKSIDVQSADPKILLTMIWHVECGLDYDTAKHAGNPFDIPNETQHIAIRTLSGEGEIQLTSGDSFALTADTVIITKVINTVRFYCKKPNWSFESYHFETESASRMMLHQVRPVHITETERRMSEDCHKSLGSASYSQVLYAQNLFKSMLALWHIENERHSLHDASIEHCLSYTIRHLSLKTTVPQIAEALNMSEKKLRRIFIEHSGMPPKRYVEEKRLKDVLTLLETSTMTIKEIADQCGFYNQVHLNRTFKKKFGYPPKIVRMSISKDQ